MPSNEPTRQTTRKKSTRGPAQRTTHRTATQRVRETESMPVDLPILGHVELPRPEELAYYVGLAVLAAAWIIDWPVALVLAAGHALNYSHHSCVANELGDALEGIHEVRELGEALDESGVAEEISEAFASPPG
jgi:hypothetical protein